jgi:hypothetical protein
LPLDKLQCWLTFCSPPVCIIHMLSQWIILFWYHVSQ